MELLLAKVRLIHGELDWSTWTWEAREYGRRERRTVRLRFEGGGGFVPAPPF